jgi:hypothetical protein
MRDDSGQVDTALPGVLTSAHFNQSPAAKAHAVTKPLPVPKVSRSSRSVSNQRIAAKAGMGVSLGALVWTAMARSRKVMRYHTLAGVALLGFTVWHLTLYRARNKTFDE